MTVAIGARIVRGAAWSAVESWGRHLFNAAIIVILARQLGAEEFGLAALAMVMPAILAVPVINGVPDALVQRPHVDPMHLDFGLLASRLRRSVPHHPDLAVRSAAGRDAPRAGSSPSWFAGRASSWSCSRSDRSPGRS